VGDLLKSDSGDKRRARWRLADMTDRFMAWASPELDAAHMKGEQRAQYETIYRDLA
jgi:hypothetical protein